MIGMFKESVLLEAITVPEIIARALDLGNQTYRFLELMTLVGLRLDEGTVEVDGRSMWHMEKRGRTFPASEKYLRDTRRSVELVSQHFNRFPHMSALENVTLARGRCRGCRKRQRRSGMDLLEMVGLRDHAAQTPPARA